LYLVKSCPYFSTRLSFLLTHDGRTCTRQTPQTIDNLSHHSSLIFTKNFGWSIHIETHWKAIV
jgi:hypothetical protein